MFDRLWPVWLRRIFRHHLTNGMILEDIYQY